VTNYCKYFYPPLNLCEKITILTRFNESKIIEAIHEEPRFTIRHLQLPGLTDIILVATHHISKNYANSRDQYTEAIRLSQQIKDAEEKVGHCRTLLVGDLNMNPFEDGIVGSAALHAVSSRKIASRIARKVQSIDYPFFYNPMWNLLGDAQKHPPGTYYYSSSNHISFFWNTFDQVLIRPELVERFNMGGLSVISEIGTTDLLSNREIPKKVFSDHLPIVFSLNL